MNITYSEAKNGDIQPIYQLCKQLIDKYENVDCIDYERVLQWVRNKIENSIREYTVVSVDNQKAGYYHFYKNENGEYELDDLYIFPDYQNKGIGSEIIKKCYNLIDAPIILYVFIKNQRAVSLYQRHGFVITEERKYEEGTTEYVVKMKR
jgi:ribosomal protein S18 acetylase RimI-like enzyme